MKASDLTPRPGISSVVVNPFHYSFLPFECEEGTLAQHAVNNDKADFVENRLNAVYPAQYSNPQGISYDQSFDVDALGTDALYCSGAVILPPKELPRVGSEKLLISYSVALYAEIASDAGDSAAFHPCLFSYKYNYLETDDEATIMAKRQPTAGTKYNFRTNSNVSITWIGTPRAATGGNGLAFTGLFWGGEQGVIEVKHFRKETMVGGVKRIESNYFGIGFIVAVSELTDEVLTRHFTGHIMARLHNELPDTEIPAENLIQLGHVGIGGKE